MTEMCFLTVWCLCKCQTIHTSAYIYIYTCVCGGTEHLVRSFGRVLPPHFQREHDALVSLDGDAGHYEDARHYGGGLHEGNGLANHNTCRTETEGWKNERRKNPRNRRIFIKGSRGFCSNPTGGEGKRAGGGPISEFWGWKRNV